VLSFEYPPFGLTPFFAAILFKIHAIIFVLLFLVATHMPKDFEFAYSCLTYCIYMNLFEVCSLMKKEMKLQNNGDVIKSATLLKDIRREKSNIYLKSNS